MASKYQRPRGRDGALSTLDIVIQVLSLAKDTCGIPPAQVAIGSVSALLTMIRDFMANEKDYIDLGLCCADICKALDRGLSGRQLDELSLSVLGAIEQLTATVAEIQNGVIKQGERNTISRVFHAKNDRDAVATWRQDLNRILHVFNTELLVNNHMILMDIRSSALASQECTDDGHQLARASATMGESPPPPPRACFGRNQLVEKIVDFAENLEPIALIGAGGIGKTSIALTVLHHDRIKERFGENRRFIRCDQFPASRAHFLARLSKVTGAGVENPEDLVPLRPFLSCQDIFIVLDNSESILDPQRTNAQEIHSMVDELCQFKTVCLLITSRITVVPRHIKRPEIPMLSMEAACDIFNSIYGDNGGSSIINDLVQRLDFHALSITLLATTASHNVWDYDRLAKEWDAHHTQVLRTDQNESLATTIELSLTSPMFRKLGPDAHDLLGVIAFFPQGVDERNLDWLFPTISDRNNIFDKFCALSLAYRSNGFTTMLAPIRDHLCPEDPKSSPLLCETKDRYFTRLSVHLEPGKQGFREAQWIKSEDVNTEHLLSVFTPIDANSIDAWDACVHFMQHLYWHKPRQTSLRKKFEELPDDHTSKPECLFELSRLFGLVGNYVEQKRLLSHILKLGRGQGSDYQVAKTLGWLSDANRLLGQYEEGIRQVEEALEIFERLGDTAGQASCLKELALLLYEDEQLDAAEEAASRAINLFPGKGQESLVCQSHRVLGDVYFSKGEREKAIHHFEVALGIASPLHWSDELFWIHCSLAWLFLDEGEFNDAHAYIEQAKSHAGEHTYCLGGATVILARIWYQQGRLGDAQSEALLAIEIFEKLGAAKDIEKSKELLWGIEQATRNRLIHCEP